MEITDNMRFNARLKVAQETAAMAMAMKLETEPALRDWTERTSAQVERRMDADDAADAGREDVGIRDARRQAYRDAWDAMLANVRLCHAFLHGGTAAPPA